MEKERTKLRHRLKISKLLPVATAAFVAFVPFLAPGQQHKEKLPPPPPAAYPEPDRLADAAYSIMLPMGAAQTVPETYE